MPEVFELVRQGIVDGKWRDMNEADIDKAIVYFKPFDYCCDMETAHMNATFWRLLDWMIAAVRIKLVGGNLESEEKKAEIIRRRI